MSFTDITVSALHSGGEEIQRDPDPTFSADGETAETTLMGKRKKPRLSLWGRIYTSIHHWIFSLQYVCSSNVLIGLLLILALVVTVIGGLFLFLQIGISHSHIVPLMVRKENCSIQEHIANFSLRSPLLSADFWKGEIILSEENSSANKLYVESLLLKETNRTFRSSSVNLRADMRNCQQISSDVLCCSPDGVPSSNGTKCFVKGANSTGYIFEKSYQLHWGQILPIDGAMVFVYKRNIYRVIDTKMAKVYSVSHDERPTNLRPVQYFFSMDDSNELTELAIRDAGSKAEFVTCEYDKVSNGNQYYLVGDQQGIICGTSRLQAHIGINIMDMKFCANPIYQAVVQLLAKNDGGDQSRLSWELQVVYNKESKDETLYGCLVDDVATSLGHSKLASKIAMNCDPTAIEVYLVGRSSLIRHTFTLPKTDINSLLANSS